MGAVVHFAVYPLFAQMVKILVVEINFCQRGFEFVNPDNPYSAPLASEPAVKIANRESDSLNAVARRTFLAWEKLRLIYNAILVVVTTLVCVFEPILVSAFDFWLYLVPEAIVANLCYFCAPVVETYVSWLGFRLRWLRATLFVVGTLLACVLAVFVLVWQAAWLNM